MTYAYNATQVSHEYASSYYYNIPLEQAPKKHDMRLWISVVNAHISILR